VIKERVKLGKVKYLTYAEEIKAIYFVEISYIIFKKQNLKKYSPNIHTSLAEVKRRKLIDSGAIHLIGNFPLEARRLIL
jgi:hypothetical protein